MSLLEVDALSIGYDGKDVVREVSFSIAKGEAVGLVGESGSGKSQTALAILGLLPPLANVQGSIRFRGTELIASSQDALNRLRATGIGMVFQDPALALNPYLSVGRQLRQVLLSHALAGRKAANDRVTEMLARVGLPDPARQAEAYPHELSGGMRQRVMIAAALIAGPDLLIADEPTTALDVTVQAQILELLASLREETSLLLITHDLGVVAGHCQRTLVLKDGELVESASTERLFNDPQHPHTRALLQAAPRLDALPPYPPASSAVRLRVEEAAVSYRIAGGRRLHAVSTASLTLAEGETLAIVGESGSGKSSLVHSLMGLQPMRSGRVVYAGEALPAELARRSRSLLRSLQLVFQDPVRALNPQMRVLDLVAEPLDAHAAVASPNERRDRVSETLARVELDATFLSRYPHQLSGGEAQRVALARALVLQPKVLICDEAVAALDGTVRQRILRLLRETQQETGLSIVFISHDLAVVRVIAHRVAVMYAGQVVEIAENRHLFAAPAHPYTRALLHAVPVPEPGGSHAGSVLQGEVPSALEPPDGCRFHPRCPHAAAICRTSVPALVSRDGRKVACHLAGDL